jgi:hypothetical protein
MLQVGMGYSPLASGIRMLVFTMMPMIFAPLAGIGSDKIGNRPSALTGCPAAFALTGALVLAVLPAALRERQAAGNAVAGLKSPLAVR